MGYRCILTHRLEHLVGVSSQGETCDDTPLFCGPEGPLSSSIEGCGLGRYSPEFLFIKSVPLLISKLTKPAILINYELYDHRRGSEG